MGRGLRRRPTPHSPPFFLVQSNGMQKQTLARIDVVLSGLLVISLAANVAGLIIFTKDNNTLSIEKQNLLKANTKIQDDLETANNTITTLSDKINSLSQAYDIEKGKNTEFENQLKDLGSIVGDLDKLSKTDKELLEKYSKVYFLNENYTPSRVNRINPDYVLAGKDPQYFHADAMKFLNAMIKDAASDNIDLKVVSAYRSFDHQNALKGQYTTTYGTGANAFSADQGYSEHQLGTTLDITDPETGGTYTSFADTEAYQWLLNNAYKHGFILSYPENNDYYIFEPWHWRFVGEQLARDLHRENANFYDLDQRDIDTYLISLFD